MGKIIRNNYRKWIEMVMLPILLVAGFLLSIHGLVTKGGCSGIVCVKD